MGANSNFCTLNNADPSAYQPIRNANLETGHNGSGSDAAGRAGTMYVKSGKWYWEVHQVAVHGSDYPYLGITVGSHGSCLDGNRAYNYGPVFNAKNGSVSSQTAGYTGLGTLTTSTTGVTAAAAGDIVNFALDMDNRKFWIGLNGTYFNSGNPATGTNAQFSWTADEYVAPYIYTYSTNRRSFFNFGQDSSFGGGKSTGSEASADGNGYGDFYDTPPSGFLAICSANLPISSDIDPATTDSNYPQKNFGVVLYTGNASTNAVTGLGFQPDFIVGKIRNTASNGYAMDSSRGVTKKLFTTISDAESTNSNNLVSFDSDGFTLGGESTHLANFNGNTNTYVAWCWRANGGTTSTNTDGTITTTVQANTAGGFSIVTFTGNGVDGASMGHGLGASPECIWIKNRDANDSWAVYHQATGNASHLLLDGTAGVSTGSAYWNSFTPSSTIFKTGNDHKLNADTEKYVAYCWSEVKGYSKFGAFKGNGNTNGPFIYTGFRPKFVWIKRTDGSHYWYNLDTARSVTGGNPITQLVTFDNHGSEGDHGSTNNIDFLSNGWKMRTSGGSLNGTGNFIWGAFGDVPHMRPNTF